MIWWMRFEPADSCVENLGTAQPPKVQREDEGVRFVDVLLFFAYDYKAYIFIIYIYILV